MHGRDKQQQDAYISVHYPTLYTNWTLQKLEIGLVQSNCQVLRAVDSLFYVEQQLFFIQTDRNAVTDTYNLRASLDQISCLDSGQVDEISTVLDRRCPSCTDSTAS